jgi:hypothetical protein
MLVEACLQVQQHIDKHLFAFLSLNTDLYRAFVQNSSL